MVCWCCIKHLDELWVKRLIGKGGDQLVFEDRSLYLNTKKVTHAKHFESLVKGDRHRVYSSYLEGDWGPVFIEDKHVFLMGDNRANSEDSRMFGAVPESLLFGKVVMTFWKPEWVAWIMD
ncbi:MAG: signal peptidase I [Mariprofundaceae bacterium]|nr:signal peptidase I [Mariprofundaceae bacterium]